MDAITVVIIAVGGWIVGIFIAVWGWKATHRLNVKAQNEAFLNQVINEARLQITGAIRDYQDWLVSVYASIPGLSTDLMIEKRGPSADRYRKAAELRDLYFSDRRGVEWVFRLEEYEILFPKTAECRRQLVGRQGLIDEHLSSLVEGILLEDPKRLQKIIRDAEENADILLNQQILLEYLRIYLQNFCLSSFTGNKIPTRKPKDPSLPRLVEDNDGNLRIVAEKKKPTEVHNW